MAVLPVCLVCVVLLLVFSAVTGVVSASSSLQTQDNQIEKVYDDGQNVQQLETFFSKQSHNNWAVLVCTSRFWFNYRHIANTLSIYHTVKRLGIPDSNIILMLADDVACNPRNVFPGTVINNAHNRLDLYGSNVEVDYRGYEVTVENFIRVLTDRHPKTTPRSKRLLSDDRSNVLVYMTGHGGDEFLKFQDAEELSSYDLGDAFAQMWEKRRYKSLMFMIDTCQANTMYEKLYSPNILATGSSRKGENSYSHHEDTEVGVAVIDRFTYYNLEFLENVQQNGKQTLKQLFDTYTYNFIHSHPGVRTDLFNRRIDEVKVTEFFGGIQDVEIVTAGYKLANHDGKDRKNVGEKLKVNYLRDYKDMNEGLDMWERPVKVETVRPRIVQKDTIYLGGKMSKTLIVLVGMTIMALGVRMTQGQKEESDG